MIQMTSNNSIAMNTRSKWLFAASALALTTAAAPAFAQSTAATDSKISEIVVTGTLVRGVAPVGVQVSSVTQKDIQRTGAQSTNELLTSIPQVTNAFNVVPTTPSGAGRSTFRPNLRNVSNIGHSTTLLLMDGHNMVGSGILQTTADLGIIPRGAIERVEVVADGGSATYGSDAVSGIINMITRTRFNGLEIKGNAGFANGYHSYTTSITGGMTFDRGSFLVAYDWRENSPLYNSSRDRPRQDLRPFGGRDFGGTGCAPGAIKTPNGSIFTAPNFTAVSAQPTCDLTAQGVLFAQEHQNSIFSSFTYQVAPNIDFELKALGSQRRTTNPAAQRNTAGASITNANPFFHSINGETTQTVYYSYASVLGSRLQNVSGLDDYQITPTLTWHAGNGWRVRAMVDYGWSNTTAFNPQVNTAVEATALRGAGLTTSTALNPYNLALTNPGVIANIVTYGIDSGSIQSLATARVIADGSIFKAPGGDVRLAVGAQFQRETSLAHYNPGQVGQTVNNVTVAATRDVGAIFGELVVPLVGPDNALPLLHSLEFDVSARYDKYNDVGATANPKVGFSWGVFDGLKVRGNWGTAFVAPSLADTNGSADISVILAATTVLRPGDPASALLRPQINVAGGTPGLSPMPATTWSIGTDFAPTFAPGLKFGLTYFSIQIDKLVGIVPFSNPLLYSTPAYAPFYISNPTQAQALAATTNAGPLTGFSSIASVYGIGQDPYTLVDVRRKNLGSLVVNGLDYSMSYDHPVKWGAVFAQAGGELFTTRSQQAVQGAAKINQLANGMPAYNVTATVGTDIGERFTMSATANYTPGYALVGVTNQTSYGSFMPVNLFFKYDFGHDLVGTLNIDNVLDTKVPFANVSGGISSSAGFLQASTIGRFVNFGISKRF
jgi:iron complex outermembrane receptor protein